MSERGRQPSQSRSVNEGEEKPMFNEEEAKKTLEQLRKFIEENNPAKNEMPKDIQQLRPSTDAGMIKYFKRITKEVKQNFQAHQKSCLLSLQGEGPSGSGPKTGKLWHSSLSKCIFHPSRTSNEVGKYVITALDEFLGVKLLQAEFPLYGYMIDKDNEEKYFWNGNADAIGRYGGKFVIVEWKTVDLLEFWEKNRDAYGKYLHQCLVYAKLLQLHLGLGELPHILIVPINNQTGKEIHPTLFDDFPEKCKEKLNSYTWLIEVINKTKIRLPPDLVNREYQGQVVDGETMLCELFKKSCKVKDLLKVFKLEVQLQT